MLWSRYFTLAVIVLTAFEFLSARGDTGEPLIWRDPDTKGNPLRWSPQLQSRFNDLFTQHQFPQDCSSISRYLFVDHLKFGKPGLFATYHGFEIYAIAGLASGRFVAQVPVPGTHSGRGIFAGCNETTLHCFFRPLWKSECVTPQLIEASTDSREIFSEVKSLHVPLTFNAKIRDSNLKTLMTKLAGTDVPPMDGKTMRFILIALFTQYAQPREDILEKARSLYPSKPTVLTQIRRTDKKKEIREDYEGSPFLPTEVFAGCTLSVADYHQLSAPRIHVVSDDAQVYSDFKSAMPSVPAMELGVKGNDTNNNAPRALGKKYVSPSQVRCYQKPCVEHLSAQPPNATITYYPFVANELGREITELLQTGGHEKIPALSRFTFHVNFLVDLFTALVSPDVHFCVTFSSNIGRFINEYVAGRNRVVQFATLGEGGVSLDVAWASLY